MFALHRPGGVFGNALVAVLGFAALWNSRAIAAEYFIAPTGSNNNTGAIGSPWGTFDYAISRINAGDTLYVRGGTYNLSSQIVIQKGGTSGNPLNLWAYPGETPVLDFSGMTTAWGSSSSQGIQVKTGGDYLHFKGLTIQNARDNGMWVSGSNNVFEQLVMRWNGDSGFQLSGSTTQHPSNNLILNSDSYENYDPQNHGENADGFVAKFRELGSGNVFRGDRAWSNSDDGWDFWAAAYGVTVDNCWAFKNGINIWGDTAFAGDGNGIKLGHDSGTHLVENMLVWGNPANGVDVNGNATPDATISPPDVPHGVTIYNVTSYNNGGKNFRFDENYAHVMRNNISYGGSVTINGPVDDLYNTWNGIPVDAADFLSLSDIGATGPRQTDGSLPVLDFLRLAADSNLIDAGIDVGLPYNGLAPDLGAFETTPIVYAAGDFNEDGSVDATDLVAWQTGYGTASGATHVSGDADDDGDVDGADFLVWQNDFTGMSPLNAALAVPEPVSFAFGILTLLTGCFMRHQT